MFKLITALFDGIGVKYTHNYLKKVIDETPYNDSMYGVNIVLNRFNVPHRCVRFVNKENLNRTDIPFITIYKDQFTLVNNCSPNGVVDLYIDGQTHQTDILDFCQLWNGTAIIIVPNKNMCEENYRTHTLDDRRSSLKNVLFVGLTLSLVIVGVMSLYAALGWGYEIIFALNAMGLFVSFLLLQKQLHLNSKVADKICGLATKSSCSDIIETKAATILGLVKLGEVGFGFFLANEVILLCFPQSSFWLAIFAIMVLPFSFWSLWYQKYRARKWCPLCIFVLAIMWAQAAVYIITGALSRPSFSLITPMVIGITYILFVLSTNKVMALIGNLRYEQEWRPRYNNIKYNDAVINAFMSDSNIFDISKERCSSLIFGNANAEKTITIFSNPYCGPCALMHNKIKELPLNCVRVQYVMTYFSEDKCNINKAIIAAYQQLGSDTAWQILSDWFAGGQKSGIDFFSIFNLTIDTPEVEIEFNKQSEWSNDERLIGTPTDLINGREIVWPYTINDCTYLF